MTAFFCNPERSEGCSLTVRCLILHVAPSLKKRRRMSLWYWAIASVFTVAIIGFLVWFNYGWISWNLPSWKGKLEAMELTLFGDVWESQARKLSGRRAIDCGRVKVHENANLATECALKAFHEKSPFRVRYDLRGIDSNVSAGLVFTPECKLYAITFDGDPQGQGGTSWSRQRAEKTLCPTPFQVYVNPNGRANCFGKEAVAPHDIMSPNAESY
jgi:hypothetical protein